VLSLFADVGPKKRREIGIKKSVISIKLLLFNGRKRVY